MARAPCMGHAVVCMARAVRTGLARALHLHRACTVHVLCMRTARASHVHRACTERCMCTAGGAHQAVAQGCRQVVQAAVAHMQGVAHAARRPALPRHRRLLARADGAATDHACSRAAFHTDSRGAVLYTELGAVLSPRMQCTYDYTCTCTCCVRSTPLMCAMLLYAPAMHTPPCRTLEDRAHLSHTMLPGHDSEQLDGTGARRAVPAGMHACAPAHARRMCSACTPHSLVLTRTSLPAHYY